jgi:hypothetical protein
MLSPNLAAYMINDATSRKLSVIPTTRLIEEFKIVERMYSDSTRRTRSKADIKRIIYDATRRDH